MRKSEKATWMPLLAVALVLAAQPASAQDVGLVENSFVATYVPTSPGCKSLLVTGQFMAPTPGYTVTLAEDEPQDNPMLLRLKLSAVPPTGNVVQVLTLTPVEYADPDFSNCPYGVSIVYDKQQIIMGLMPARSYTR